MSFRLMFQNWHQANYFSLIFFTIFSIATGDFIAGWAHYLLDNYPGMNKIAAFTIGESFVSQYSVHHKYPDDLMKYNFFETNSDGMFATSCALSLVYVWMRFRPGIWTSYSVSWMWYWIVYFIFVAFTNQCHKWSHNKNPNFVIKTFHRLHITLPPEEHQRHHDNPKVAICLTTGWCNYFLESIDYWRYARKSIKYLFT